MSTDPCTIALTIILSIPAFIAAVVGPDSADMMAVLGAIPATVIVVLHSQSKAKSLRDAVMCFCGSIAFGGIGPGALLNWVSPQSIPALTWHTWAGLGFIFGLAGWALAIALLLFMNRNASKIVSKGARRFIDTDTDSKAGEKIP